MLRTASVAMAAYNGERFLPQQIESIHRIVTGTDAAKIFEAVKVNICAETGFPVTVCIGENEYNIPLFEAIMLETLEWCNEKYKNKPLYERKLPRKNIDNSVRRIKIKVKELL